MGDSNVPGGESIDGGVLLRGTELHVLLFVRLLCTSIVMCV